MIADGGVREDLHLITPDPQVSGEALFSLIEKDSGLLGLGMALIRVGPTAIECFS